MKTTAHITESLAALGFSLLITSGPKGEVRDNDWPCIAYKVQLQLHGKPVIETDYSLGVGHVKIPKNYAPMSLTQDERRALEVLQGNPRAQFRDKALHASLAAKLALAQKVVPQLADVMHSLLSDGEAYFDAMTFEDWAANFGYDADSRKAESIFRKCDEIGRTLARGIPADLLPRLREIVAEL